MIIEYKGSHANGELDPQVERLLKMVDDAASDDSKPLSATSPTEIRAAIDPIESFGIPVEEVGQIRNLTISGTHGEAVSVRVYTPKGAGIRPILLFFHGGCWVFCDLDTHDNICRYLCNHADCLVVSVDYRLAPEHKFPAGVEDAYEVVRWLQENARQLGGDPAKIAVGGDSAGGNIAAVVAMMARDRQELSILFQLLIYPITNIDDLQTESYMRFQTGYFLSREMMEWAGNHYITHEEERRQPYVSPLLTSDLRGLPPALVISAESDILRDEGEAYALRLAEAGNSVRAIRYRGMVHAFVAMAGFVDAGRIALEDCAAELRKAFG